MHVRTTHAINTNAHHRSTHLLIHLCQVNIRILEPEESGASTASASSASRVVRIFGNNAQNVASARAEVEYVEEARPFPRGFGARKTRLSLG